MKTCTPPSSFLGTAVTEYHSLFQKLTLTTENAKAGFQPDERPLTIVCVSHIAAGITFISSGFVWERIIFSLVVCYYIGADC